MRSKIKYLDYGIFIPFLLLMTIGLVMIYSASSDLMIINKLDPTSYLKRQLIFAVLALFIGGIVFSLKIRLFKSKSLIKVLLFGVIAMLLYLMVLKLVKGDSAAVNGAVGWINLGSFNIQPVEFAKLILILYLGFILANRDGRFVPGRIVYELTAPSIIAIFFDASHIFPARFRRGGYSLPDYYHYVLGRGHPLKARHSTRRPAHQYDRVRGCGLNLVESAILTG